MKAQDLGKHNNFDKAQSKTDKDAHFAVVHYEKLSPTMSPDGLRKIEIPLTTLLSICLKRPRPVH